MIGWLQTRNGESVMGDVIKIHLFFLVVSFPASSPIPPLKKYFYDVTRVTFQRFIKLEKKFKTSHTFFILSHNNAETLIRRQSYLYYKVALLLKTTRCD